MLEDTPIVYYAQELEIMVTDRCFLYFVLPRSLVV